MSRFAVEEGAGVAPPDAALGVIVCGYDFV